MPSPRALVDRCGGEQLLQGLCQGIRARKPLGRLPFDRALHEPNEARRQILPSLAQRRPPVQTMRLAHVGRSLATDRVLAGDEVIQEDADAVDVRLRCCRGYAAPEFRREIERRAGQFSRGRHRGFHLLASGAEVHQHHATAFLAHDVGRLDIPVNESGTMHRREGPAKWDADLSGVIRAESALRAYQLGERATVDEFGPDADAPTNAFGAVHRHDVGVPNTREKTPLVYDAVATIRSGVGRAKQLERDFAVEPRVPRAIDVAKCPAAYAFEQAERAPGLGLPRRPPMQRRQAFQHAQGAQFRIWIGPVFGRQLTPVHRAAVEDRARRSVERQVVRFAVRPLGILGLHESIVLSHFETFEGAVSDAAAWAIRRCRRTLEPSPAPAGAARASRPVAPRRRSVSQGPLRVLRKSNPSRRGR